MYHIKFFFSGTLRLTITKIKNEPFINKFIIKELVKIGFTKKVIFYILLFF